MSPEVPVRIANCSGFYGDRLSAALEMVDGGPIDVLTGDYLAELTMLILAKAQAKDPATGYARTFLTQLEQVLGTCVDRGVRVVANAGGLNPAGLAAAVRELAQRMGITVNVAHVEGDDLRDTIGAITPPPAVSMPGSPAHPGSMPGSPAHPGSMPGSPAHPGSMPGSPAHPGGKPVSANAYLGGWGIAAALGAGADVVVTGRVTDASLVVGPAAWWHGWAATEWHALAGAVVAGHVIECGPQATGGNYAFHEELPDLRLPGFPIAEVAADGSAVITKHPGTGGLVSIGTVTAQVLYEIAAPAYLGPDVTAHFDTIALTQQAPDRVAISGVRGSPPPATLKVALNEIGGFRNSVTLVLTGLDIEAKAARAEAQLFESLGGKERFDEVDVRLQRFDHPDAPSNEQATAHLRITVKDADARRVGRAFTGAAVEQALAGYAGFHATTPPGAETAFGVYRPAAVARAAVEQVVVLDGGDRMVIADPPTGAIPPDPEPTIRALPIGPTVRAPLGRVCGARSGDKGGNANIGIWARDDAGHAWMSAYLTVDRLRELLGPEAADLDVQRFDLPNLRAINVVVVGLLGAGVASSTRPDAQAKGLGEYLRSRVVDVPEVLLRC